MHFQKVIFISKMLPKVKKTPDRKVNIIRIMTSFRISDESVNISGVHCLKPSKYIFFK